MALDSEYSVIVTGGGSGIGFACARAFAEEGAALVLIGRSEVRLKAAIDTLLDEFADTSVTYVPGDVADESVIVEAVSTASALAPLRVAVANAGTGAFGPLVDIDLSTHDRIMAVNLNGVLATFKHAGKTIAKNGGGAMCAISSIAGTRTHRFMSSYCVSKAAIDMLVRNAADELGTAGVRVNGVSPGLVETEISELLRTSTPVLDDYLQCMPLARTGQPEEIAAAVKFLCGAQASWITGVNLAVDGGHHLRRGPNLSSLRDHT